jgi:hypothetical protein
MTKKWGGVLGRMVQVLECLVSTRPEFKTQYYQKKPETETYTEIF